MPERLAGLVNEPAYCFLSYIPDEPMHQNENPDNVGHYALYKVK